MLKVVLSRVDAFFGIYEGQNASSVDTYNIAAPVLSTAESQSIRLYPFYFLHKSFPVLLKVFQAVEISV